MKSNPGKPPEVINAGPVTAGQDATATLSALGSNRELGLTSAEAQRRLGRDGANEIPPKRHHPLLAFARKFWGLSAWMIELIAILSWALGKYTDFAVALALLVVNAVLSFMQEQRASAAVELLRSRLQVTARVLRDGAWNTRSARELVAGDVVRLRSGDFVPADAQVIDGTLAVDQSALTGESRELEKAKDAPLYSGSIVRTGEATSVVTATGARTYFGHTTVLVETARPKLHVEEVIGRVVKWLFLIVGALVAVAVAVSLLEGYSLLTILPLALVLLMGAVPVALPVMFTVSMAVGARTLAHQGVLVTRLSAAEDAANLDVLCADKTGTLTQNRLAFADAEPQAGQSADDVLRYGAWASNEANADPIDLAFIEAARRRKLALGAEVLSFIPFSAEGRRTEASLSVGGRTLRVMKGALRTVASEAGLDETALSALEARANEAAGKGFRTLAVAKAEGTGPWQLVGMALLADPLRPDSRNLIERLRALGVTIKMLTGDALPVAREIARSLGLSGIERAPELRQAIEGKDANAERRIEASDGFAEVFPEDKFDIVKSLQDAGHVAGMTGDGVNDAPALRQAEVGIAVSGATDVAKGAASVVLTTEGLSGIVDLITNGRAVYQRVLTWIINKISRTILKSGLVVIALLVTGKLIISAFGIVLLMFMTDFVKISLSTDHVRPSTKPESWNIGPLVWVAALIGLMMLLEALGLLAFGWTQFDLGTHAGQLQTFTYQTLLFFALFSIVSIRERRAFWASRPSLVLAASLFADGCLGILIGIVGLAELKPLPLAQTAVIFTYALVCSLGLNDLLKRLMISWLARAEHR
ncbi:MAG: plasma-membrane proton-efflux P-type ATPase [Sphingomonadales bacterium]|nr:plasma-membrane proton-efflux P-type ATPase [Sphingomonadales bacterium]MDE2623725.1 plasma-membrane proton-efflux P-type ATPase [Betaproteobacteria bacterium]